jgi:hypothetical protein
LPPDSPGQPALSRDFYSSRTSKNDSRDKVQTKFFAETFVMLQQFFREVAPNAPRAQLFRHEIFFSIGIDRPAQIRP